MTRQLAVQRYATALLVRLRRLLRQRAGSTRRRLADDDDRFDDEDSRIDRMARRNVPRAAAGTGTNPGPASPTAA